MILLKDFLELCNYKITDGYEYQWHCFGTNANVLVSEGDEYSMQIVFDTKNQTPYSVEVCDYRQDRAYRIINPGWQKLYYQECTERDCDDYAWDTVKWIDLEVDEDFIEKAKSIMLGIKYDTGIQVPVDLSKDELYDLMMRAHERNMTLNQLVAEVLEEFIAERNSTVAQR